MYFIDFGVMQRRKKTADINLQKWWMRLDFFLKEVRYFGCFLV
jgi:hypothetical protein